MNFLAFRYTNRLWHSFLWSGKDTLVLKESFDFSGSITKKKWAWHRPSGFDISNWTLFEKRDSLMNFISMGKFQALQQFINQRGNYNNPNSKAWYYFKAKAGKNGFIWRHDNISPLFSGSNQQGF